MRWGWDGSAIYFMTICPCLSSALNKASFDKQLLLLINTFSAMPKALNRPDISWWGPLTGTAECSTDYSLLFATCWRFMSMVILLFWWEDSCEEHVEQPSYFIYVSWVCLLDVAKLPLICKERYWGLGYLFRHLCSVLSIHGLPARCLLTSSTLVGEPEQSEPFTFSVPPAKFISDTSVDIAILLMLPMVFTYSLRSLRF